MGRRGGGVGAHRVAHFRKVFRCVSAVRGRLLFVVVSFALVICVAQRESAAGSQMSTRKRQARSASSSQQSIVKLMCTSEAAAAQDCSATEVSARSSERTILSSQLSSVCKLA